MENRLCPEKSVYILLTRSGTWFSRLIHLATDDSYTHASIGLDGPAGPFYSFARKYERFALPAGLVVEEVGVETKRRQIPCCLYELSVPVPVYDCLRRQLNRMYAQRDRYHYNLLGALTCYFNYPLPRENHYFCSQFAASLLERSGAVELVPEYMPIQLSGTSPMEWDSGVGSWLAYLIHTYQACPVSPLAPLVTVKVVGSPLLYVMV